MRYLEEMKEYFLCITTKTYTYKYKKYVIEIYKSFEFYILPTIILNKWFNRWDYKTKKELSFRFLKIVIALYFKK